MYFVNDADKIINGLWLGNYNSSQDKLFLNQNNIKVIINCTKNLNFLKHDKIKYIYRVPIDDNLQEDEIKNMEKWILKTVRIIHYHLSEKNNILIHCAAGMQRSAIIVLSYLFEYKYSNNDVNKIVDFMRSKRPIVFTPGMNFRNSFYNVYRHKLK